MKKSLFSTLGIGIALSVVGCGTTTTASPTATPTAKTTTSATATPGKSVSAWASMASATSSYGSASGSSWNASQATGAPTVTACGDNGDAWASLAKNTVDTLTLAYDQSVMPTSIEIHESFHPGYVTTVTVTGTGGQTATVYTGTPAAVSTCPTTLTIPVTDVTFAVDTVAVTVDQSTLNDWSEIDAVQLTGTATTA